MNFGNFFRNLSQDKEASNASGSGLFAAPGRLLESVTAKTGSLVSDLSHKVDLAKKIDTLKKYSSMDKFGQSVLGTAFQTNQSNDPTNKPTEGETQLAQPLCQEQRQQNYRNKQSIDQIYSDQPPTQSGLQNRLLNEQRDYKGSLEQPSYTGELPTNQNQQPEQDIFKSPQNILHPQEEPTYGYQNKAHEQTDNQIRSPKQSSCVDYPRFQEDDGFLTQQPREKTWALEKEKPMEEPPFSGQEYRYKSTFETPPQPSLKTFGDLRKFGIEEDMERMSFDEQITDRHKNPFNCETSFDATNARKSTAPIMRQSTTPGARPPRPPPPRSRSGLSSGSIEESPSATPKEAATSPTPTSPCGSFQKTLSFGEETEEGVTKKSSTSEIGYLTRLQCQEIVSAVDNMIADAIEEAPQYHRYEPMKQADSYESSSRVEEMCGTSTPSDTVFDSHRTSEVKNEYFAGDSEVSSVSTYGASVTGSATQRADENKFKTMGSTDDSWGRQDTPGGYDDGDAKSAKHSVDFAKTAISAEDVSRKFIRDYVQGMIAGNDVALESKNEEFREKMLTPRGREYFSKAMELEVRFCSGNK
uniref:SBF2 domain-containing protein n=1 Tax=Mesocestoides corti TaxID=53468 RepID=A0A5K3EMZ8_MESCO